MAKNDGITLEKLYIELGLDLSQLQSDILAADRTVSENISRLNREKNIIKLRMEADIAGLDRTIDAAKIFEIQQASLNQQLAISKDRMMILEAAYQQVAQNSNSTSMAVQNAEKAFLKEKIAVGQLEQAIKNLSSQKISLDTSRLQDAVSKLNSRIQHVRIQAEIDTSKLKDVGNVFDAQKARIAAVTRELELQRQKLIQLREAMYKSAQSSGRDSVQTLNIQSNVLQQIREINQLEIKLKELKSTNINLQIRADSIRQAEQTIQDNIARINARIDNIKIKADIDVSKLGSAASEFDKAKAHVQGLNRELELQNQKLAEMRKAFATSVSANGLNNVKTINLSTEIQKQIQEINQLEAKIKELNNIAPPKTNNLLSGYLNFKGNVTGTLNEFANAYSQLQGATASADSAIVASLGVIGTIPSPVGRAVAAFAALPIVLKGVENSLIDMTRAAAASGDAVYVMSRGFQMSFSDTAKFVTNAKTAGTDVNSLAMAVKRVQQQIVKGGDDGRAAKQLKRYGESAYDASGHLKNLNEMTFVLSRALHKAQDEGRGMEFILSMFRNISADDITAIEDWADVAKQASTTVSNGLANPALAHEVQGNINQLNDQAAKMNATFSSALLPVTNEIVPRLTERMGKLTQIIADNKEVIRSFGRTAADTFLKIEEAAESVAKVFGSVAKAYYDWQKNPHQDEIVEKYKNDTSIKNVDDLIKKEQPKAYDLIKSNPALYNQTLAIYQPIFDALSDVQDEVRRRQEELEKILKQPLSVADASTIGQERRAIDQNPESLETLRRARKYQEEADAVLYKMNHSEFENKKLDLFNWYNELVREAELSNEERLAIEKLFAAKSAQIEQDRQKKNAEIREREQEHLRNAADIEYELTHTAFEKQIRDIERWEELQKRKAESTEEAAAIGAEAVAKEAQAFEREMDRIKGTLQSLDDKIFEQEHSQAENDLRRIQQERIRYYEDFQKNGILNEATQAKIERWYQNAVGKLNMRAQKGGDYTAAPDNGLQRGGNGIMVIGGDKILDDGLIQNRQKEIGLIADESQERAQLMQRLPQEARDRLAAIESTRQLSEAQKLLEQQTRQTAGSIQVIEGDKIVSQPQDNQVVSDLQQFGDALQQQVDPIKALQDSAQDAATAQKSLADSVKDFPPDYFKQLADGVEAVSEMQLNLTKSTMELIDAQGKLANELDNLPVNRDTGDNRQTPDNGMLRLATSTQDVRQEQDLLARTARDATNSLAQISDIPPQAQIAQKDSGFKAGFDYDTAKDILLTGVGLAAASATTGVGLALSPEILAGAIVAAGVGGFAKGSYDATTATPELDDRLQPLSNIDLSAIVTPLSSIDANIQSFLQAVGNKEQPTEMTMPEWLSTPLNNFDTPLSSILHQMQDSQPYADDRLQELFGSLPNIDANVLSVLQELQARAEIPETTADQPPATIEIDYLTPLTNIEGNLQSVLGELQSRETTLSFETVITPLNNIAGLVQNILTALGDRQPPQITVSPNNNINLGGAYVFDNAMKKSLVDDITTRIVREITNAVQQATSRSSYGFSA